MQRNIEKAKGERIMPETQLIWIAREGDEGMTVTNEAFLKMLEKFFNENYQGELDA